jgi:hypothetical protein
MVSPKNDGREVDLRLLPCPICGHKTTIRSVADKNNGNESWQIACKANYRSPPWHTVEIIWFGTRDEAIAKWNFRPILK